MRTVAPDPLVHVGTEGRSIGPWGIDAKPDDFDGATTHDAALSQHVALGIDDQGRIHLRGLVKGGTVGQRVFTLPGIACPWYDESFPVLSATALDRDTVQDVTPTRGASADVGSNAWVDVNGVSYPNHTLDSRVGAGAAAVETGGRGDRRTR